MCGPFSSMNNINYSGMTTEEKERQINYGREHLDFCMKLYFIQWRDRRDFLHEHPESACSWHKESVTRMLKRQGVVRVTGDQCRYGLIASDGQRTSPARKSTSVMTNSPCIAQKLYIRCPNNREYKVHDHVIFVNGRAKTAQVYPPPSAVQSNLYWLQGTVRYRSTKKLSSGKRGWQWNQQHQTVARGSTPDQGEVSNS